MTEHDQPTDVGAPTSAEETILTLPPIDYNAPGSRRLEKERRRFADGYQAAVTAYNETVDDLNDARQTVIADPENEALHTQLAQALAALAATRDALDVAREDYHQHLISRMTTSDGSSVAEALDQISQNEFLALVRADVESVSLPKAGAASSSGG